MTIALLKVEIRYEQDVVLARKRARQISSLLSFGQQDQIRLATAVSELARNVFQYTPGGTVAFSLRAGEPGQFCIKVSDNGTGIDDLDTVMAGNYRSKTGMGLGLVGARRLVDDFDIVSTADGTIIDLCQPLPRGLPPVSVDFATRLVRNLSKQESQSPFEEMQVQNQELLAALGEIQQQQQQISQINRDLDAALLKAEQANQAKTDFLANMSHEIRTPLNAILGLTTLIGRTPLSERQEKFVSTLQQSATSMAALVNDLLDVSKIEDNKIVLEAIPFNVSDLIQKVIEISSVNTAKASLNLVFAMEPATGTHYVGDPQRIQQILINLVSNAVKFTAEGSVAIKLSERSRDDGRAVVHIAVQDSGIGIAPDALDKIFEKFVQADSSTTRRFGGTGLGLSIARGLARQMGGDLSVTSVEGEGSVFTFAVPLGLHEADVAPDVPLPPRPSPADRGLTVLVVEDNPANVVVATALLEDLGYGFHVATTGEDALILLAREPVDIILMDIQMDGMDGFETTSRLRALEANLKSARHPVIAMTAYGALDQREKCLAAGMDDYLAKPVDPLHFETILHRHAASLRANLG